METRYARLVAINVDREDRQQPYGFVVTSTSSYFAT